MIKEIIAPVLLVIASAVGFYFFIDPTYGSVLQTQEQISKYEEALEKSQELIQLREKLVTQYNAFSSDQLEKMRTMLPQEIDKIDLIIGLNTIGENYDVRPENIQFSDDDTGGGGSGDTQSKYRTLGMQFTAAAPYSNLIAFLQAIQQSERLIDLQEITIVAPGAAGNSAGESNTEFQVSLETYAAAN